ncbi:MAG: SLBB domain-containing protein [Waddliaceae bacterium]
MDHNDRLPVHEKVAVLLICILFGIFVLLSQWNNDPLFFEIGEETQIINNEVEVQVFGEVANPGSYWVQKGTPLKDVIIKAEPTADANLKKLDQEALLVRKRVITIPKTKTITVFLNDAMERQTLKVSEGTRRGDLTDIKLKYPNRKLKDGEEFHVNRNEINQDLDLDVAIYP